MEAQNASDAAAYVRYRQSGSDGLVSKNPIYIQGWKRVGAKIYSLSELTLVVARVRYQM